MVSSLIVGCGYVGRALAHQLVERGEQVTAVSRTGVSIDGVESLERDVTDRGLSLPDAESVFYLVSADSRTGPAYRKAYVEGLEKTIDEAVTEKSTLVYSSSTGVYETTDGSWVDETTVLEPTTERTRRLLEAEQVTRNAGGVVVRFGGLYGPGRLGIDRYLGETQVPAGYLNLVHRTDAARALLVAAAGEHDCYVAVDDEPVHRHDLARWLATSLDRPVGDLVEGDERPNKRCANTRLRNEGWELAFPSFRDGYRDVLGD